MKKPNKTNVQDSILNLLHLVIILFVTVSERGQARVVESLLEMRRKDVVIQKWDYSCGAAALATLMQLQFGQEQQEKPIALAMANKDKYTRNPAALRRQQGFTILDLKNYVDQIGYEGLGYRDLTLKDLRELAPALVVIDNNGYNHFVVFKEIKNGKVYLADPGWGQRVVSVRKFLHIWARTPGMGRIAFQVAEKGK